jgi:hypothetical protein
LALLFSQIPLNLTASFAVAAEVACRSCGALRKLDRQLVYFSSVHGCQNLKVRPFSGFEWGFLWPPLNIAKQMLANKLEKSENNSIWLRFRFAYVYHSISIECHVARPHALNAVGSPLDDFLPTIRVGISELGDAPSQHANLLIRQGNFLARCAFCFNFIAQ